MPLAILYPPDALARLKELMWAPDPKTEPMFTKQFLLDSGHSEQDVRVRARLDEVTLTEAYRRLVVDKFPEMDRIWPASTRTAAQVRGIHKRTKTPDEASDLPKALDLLKRLAIEPHNLRTRNAAKKFLAARGISTGQQ